MVQSFVTLAFPLAAFFEFIINLWKKRRWLNITLRIACISLLYSAITVNLLMARQYSTTVLHWNGMTKEAYWFIYGKEKFTKEDFETRERLIKIPDMARMLNGDRNQ